MMEDQKEYHIKIEYYQHGGGAVAKLGWSSSQKDPIWPAVQTAKQSDAVILFVGTGPNNETEGYDRESLILPKEQDRLIQEVLAVNRNTIIVLNTGSPVMMDQWSGSVKGIVQAWFGGQEMSKGIIEVLSGTYNPSGKLPITFPNRWEDCSAYASYKTKDSVTEYTDGIYVGYRHFEKKKINPLFPFGFGLSYTSFQYSDLKTNVQQQGDQFQVELTLSVANTGKRNGAEVIQVYVRDTAPEIDRPVKELKAFKKVMLKTGEVQEVRLQLHKDAFAYFDSMKKTFCVRPGTYAIQVGSSSADIRLTNMIEVK
jgi:beta-glucosidase